LKNIVYIDRAKRSFKGNLHLHTTWSDGRCSPEQVVEIFKAKGYHFISFSDHDIFTRTAEFNSDSFITIPGMERGGLHPFEGKDPGFHFGVIDDPTVEPERERFDHLQTFPRPIWEGEHSVQEQIDDLRSHGNLVIYNHPEWHLARFENMVKYNSLFAIEIYNHATEWSTATSYGTAYWDYALQNGKRMFGIASDDSHEHDKNWAIPEYGGGWIQVQAAALTHYDIVNNMKAGYYYSSSGPEIYDLRVENGSLKIECSPCKFIMFKAFPQRGPFLGNYVTAAPLTQAYMTVDEDMKYIRVECIDFDGKVAWSNPVFVEDLR